MRNLLIIIDAIAAIVASAGILLQQKGVGLGSAFGGDSYMYQTRRGAEKVIFGGTVTAVVIFLVVSFLIAEIF